MNKEKIVFYCKNCGNEHAKWHGQCKYCKEWNSLKEKKGEFDKSQISY